MHPASAPSALPPGGGRSAWPPSTAGFEGRDIAEVRWRGGAGPKDVPHVPDSVPLLAPAQVGAHRLPLAKPAAAEGAALFRHDHFSWAHHCRCDRRPERLAGPGRSHATDRRRAPARPPSPAARARVSRSIWLRGIVASASPATYARHPKHRRRWVRTVWRLHDHRPHPLNRRNDHPPQKNIPNIANADVLFKGGDRTLLVGREREHPRSWRLRPCGCCQGRRCRRSCGTPIRRRCGFGCSRGAGRVIQTKRRLVLALAESRSGTSIVLAARGAILFVMRPGCRRRLRCRMAIGPPGPDDRHARVDRPWAAARPQPTIGTPDRA